MTMVMIAEGALMKPEEPQHRAFHAAKPFRYHIVTTQTQTLLAVFEREEAIQPP